MSNNPLKSGRFALGLLVGLAACTPQQPPRVDSADTTNNPQAMQQRLGKLNLQFEQVIQPDSSDHLLLPLTIREIPNGEGIIDARTYKEVDRSYYWNIAFYNTRTGEHHLLDESRKMLIHHITVNDSEADDFGSKRTSATDGKYIFYRVITADHNGDQRFDDKDLTYLFVSDRAGRGFRQLSPPGYDLLSWESIEGTGKIIMLVHQDSNKDGKRDPAEEKPAFVADLNRPGAATEILSPQDKNRFKTLYDRDWKRIR